MRRNQVVDGRVEREGSVRLTVKSFTWPSGLKLSNVARGTVSDALVAHSAVWIPQCGETMTITVPSSVTDKLARLPVLAELANGG